MALKDKKKWLALFQTRWGYQSESEIKKKKGYQGKIDLVFAVAMACDSNQHFLIQLAFPFLKRFPRTEQLADSIIIFPQSVFSGESIYEIETPIFYGGEYHSLSGFISKCPPITANAECLFGTYAFSLNFFMLSIAEINRFRKGYLTKLKKHIEHVLPVARGKGEKRTTAEIEMWNFVTKQFKTFPKKRPYPIEEIQNRWLDYLSEKYPDKEPALPHNQTIRRILDSYMKK